MLHHFPSAMLSIILFHCFHVTLLVPKEYHNQYFQCLFHRCFPCQTSRKWNISLDSALWLQRIFRWLFCNFQGLLSLFGFLEGEGCQYQVFICQISALKRYDRFLWLSNEAQNQRKLSKCPCFAGSGSCLTCFTVIAVYPRDSSTSWARPELHSFSQGGLTICPE